MRASVARYPPISALHISQLLFDLQPRIAAVGAIQADEFGIRVVGSFQCDRRNTDWRFTCRLR